MILSFVDESWDDYLYWEKTDKKTLKRINLLIKEIQRHPFEGAGKPEPFRHEFRGCWSRRIDKEHRIVYKVIGEEIRIFKCRFHYD